MDLNIGYYNASEGLSASESLKISRRMYRSQNFIFIKKADLKGRRKGIIGKPF